MSTILQSSLRLRITTRTHPHLRTSIVAPIKLSLPQHLRIRIAQLAHRRAHIRLRLELIVIIEDLLLSIIDRVRRLQVR